MFKWRSFQAVVNPPAWQTAFLHKISSQLTQLTSQQPKQRDLSKVRHLKDPTAEFFVSFKSLSLGFENWRVSRLWKDENKIESMI